MNEIVAAALARTEASRGRVPSRLQELWSALFG